MSLMICPKCRTATPWHKFCSRCGSEALPAPRCFCGREFYPNDNFCEKCGKERSEGIRQRMEKEDKEVKLAQEKKERRNNFWSDLWKALKFDHLK